MAISADKTFWGFVMYVTNNPFKSIDNMTADDFWAMVKQFAAVNATAGPITVATARDLADYYGYGVYDLSGDDMDFPKRDGMTHRWAIAGNGIAAQNTYLLNMVAIKQASYPEEQANQ